MNVKFHSGIERNFPYKWQQVRAFLYTDYSIEPHTHDFYEMNIIMNGSGKHQIEDSCFDIKIGDVFVIPPMTVHAYFDTDNLDVYHILLHKNFIQENHNESLSVPGFLQLIEIEPYLRQHVSKKTFLHLSQNQLMQLKNELEFIEDRNPLDTKEMAALKNHITWKILYWFSYLIFKQTHDEEKNFLNKYDVEIIKILEYIHKSFMEKITVDLLCKKSFLSRSTFLRSFTKSCGCSPMEYVNRYRCKKALEMMDTTSLSKTEIAHNCGFYDLSHMERTIKKLL